MTGPSSLPPLKEKDAKYGVLALILLLAAAALWFFLRGCDSEPQAEPADPPAEVAQREQFATDLEIPADDTLDPDGGEAAPEEGARAPRTGGGGGDNPQSWECTGSISAAAVRAVIQGRPSKQVQTCYERGLKSNNLLQGSMQVELTIGASGAVRAVSVGGTLRDRQVYSCVRRVAKTWKFPKPTDGCVRINAPFQMTPKL